MKHDASETTVFRKLGPSQMTMTLLKKKAPSLTIIKLCPVPKVSADKRDTQYVAKLYSPPYLHRSIDPGYEV